LRYDDRKIVNNILNAQAVARQAQKWSNVAIA
jgi:hypothetical protein